MSVAFTPVQIERILSAAPAGSMVYLIGAGGCGMSGLGHLLLDLGFSVRGSDLAVNDEIRQLQARGAQIHMGHKADQLESRAVLVVHTSAVRSDNPEWKRAVELRIPVVRRAELLAALLHRQRGVCIAGMHGKTTTSALLAFALQRLGVPTSYAVGALVPQLAPHARFVSSDPSSSPDALPLFVIEADESDGTLRQFRPEHAIILNVDAEHLDHFESIEAITAEFGQFAQQTRGHLIFCGDDPRLAAMLVRNPRAISYGRHPLAAYRVEPLPHPALSASECAGAARSWSVAQFQLWHKGELLGSFSTQLLGEQNISNAASVVALLHQLGYEPAAIAEAIAPFRGAARRQQELYRDARCRIFEDYGHHPNEIRVTLRALKSLRPKRLLVVFQPHRFTRTQHLWREFASCFADADLLWLVELYPASEPEIPGINSGFLANAIADQGQVVEAVLSLARVGPVVRAAIEPGDLVLFLGAGDITQVAHQVVRDLETGSASTVSPSERASISLLSSEMKNALLNGLAARLSPATVLRFDEPLAKRTTLRVGDPAEIYVEPASESDLAEVLRFTHAHSWPVMILGRGSNLLIRDGGLRGLVICLSHPSFGQVQVDGERLRCGAGAKLKTVAVEARRQGLSGLEFLEGIPGSVGGAMRMNAGAMGSWLFDVVETIRFMDHGGEIQERRASEVNVEYRGCPLFKDHIALEAVLHGAPADKEAIRAKMDSFSRKRWESQPSQPSAGCIFKNPKAIPAGRLIDELGLKGTRVGGAVVSDVHANFIVNDGGASARDVLALIELIRDRARAARGIELETEVQILGEG